MKMDVNVLFYIVVVVYTMSGFTDVDAVWSEFPLLVQYMPEYWLLPSYSMVIIGVGSSAMILYSALRKWRPEKVNESTIQYPLNIASIVSCVLLVFFWRTTVIINGERRSLVFWVIQTVYACKTQINTVVLLPYLAKFPSVYLTAFFVGDGMCGVVPSVVSFIQGAGDYDCVNRSTVVNVTAGNVSSIEDDYKISDLTLSGNYTVETMVLDKVLRPPLFSVEVYFGITTLLLVLSFSCFLLLNHHPWCQAFVTSVTSPSAIKPAEVDIKLVTANNGQNKTHAGSETSSSALSTPDAHGKDDTNKLPAPSDSLLANNDYSTEKEIVDDSSVEVDIVVDKPSKQLSKTMSTFLMLQFGMNGGLNYGFIYPIQSYALLPYGNLAFALGNRLTTVAMPLAGILALFVPTRSIKVITAHFLVGFACAFYIMTLAILSPEPPLKDTDVGKALSVIPWIILSVCWGYNRVGIATALKESGGKDQLMWAGVANVVVSVAGSVLMFILINVLNLFKDSPPCPQ